jgi:hypothetical protein
MDYGRESKNEGKGTGIDINTPQGSSELGEEFR